MTMRFLARAAATGLLAAGAVAFATTPALAADGDLGLELKGSTIALEAEGKPATITITNNGTTTPDEVGVRFDVSKLDGSKVEIDLGECTVEDGVADCVIDKADIPGPGETTELPVPLVKKPGATGDAGKLTVTLVVDGDTNKANDSKTVDVAVRGNGVDLRVLAFDVTQVDSEGELTGKPVQPGATSIAWAHIANRGDRTAVGLKVRVSLPKLVTFTEKEEGCEYSADNRVATCTAEDYPLIPWDLDESKDKELSAISVPFLVTVSKDAKGPVSLAGGEWTASALRVEQPNVKKARAGNPAELPEFAEQVPAAVADQLEVDATDNTDGFAVLVAGPAGGSGGGDGEPGLPVTGPVAASVAGLGALVLALGVVLFVVSRRRRVVLVTPSDEK